MDRKMTEKFKIIVGRIKLEEYKRSLSVELEIELKEENEKRKTIDLEEVDKQIILSISANVWNTKHTDLIMGGQINQEIKDYLENNKFKKLFVDKETLKKILDIWERWDLNDLHSGTRKQEEALEKWENEKNMKILDFDKKVEYLKSIGLYEDRGYKYGSSWLYEPLPNEVIEFIKNLNKGGGKNEIL
jgi:hypothetical protein